MQDKKQKQTFVTEDNSLKFDKAISRDERTRLSELHPQGASFSIYSPKFEVIKPQAKAYTFQPAPTTQKAPEEKQIKCNRFIHKAEKLSKKALKL
jgi:hypothetical protein